MNFRLAVTVTGGEELTSDVLLAHVEVVPVNIWGLIILVGSILIGVVILLIVIVYLIRRPKKEPEVQDVVVQKAVPLCKQCGRALQEDLNYCPHCAAEPNNGLLKILEGPESGWTYFIRETITEIGTANENSISLQDPGVSGNHLKIVVQEGRRYLIEDLKSTNGTYIDGVRIQQQYLRDGDVIRVGTTTKIKFQIS
jgi:hypothetical protein